MESAKPYNSISTDQERRRDRYGMPEIHFNDAEQHIITERKLALARLVEEVVAIKPFIVTMTGADFLTTSQVQSLAELQKKINAETGNTGNFLPDIIKKAQNLLGLLLGKTSKSKHLNELNKKIKEATGRSRVVIAIPSEGIQVGQVIRKYDDLAITSLHVDFEAVMEGQSLTVQDEISAHGQHQSASRLNVSFYNKRSVYVSMNTKKGVLSRQNGETPPIITQLAAASDSDVIPLIQRNIQGHMMISNYGATYTSNGFSANMFPAPEIGVAVEMNESRTEVLTPEHVSHIRRTFLGVA